MLSVGKPQPGVLVTLEAPRAFVRLVGKRSLKRFKLSQVFRRTSEDLWSDKKEDEWGVRLNCTLVLLEQVLGDFYISMYAVEASNVNFVSTLQLAETFGVPESCSYDPFTKVSNSSNVHMYGLMYDMFVAALRALSVWHVACVWCPCFHA